MTMRDEMREGEVRRSTETSGARPRSRETPRRSVRSRPSLDIFRYETPGSRPLLQNATARRPRPAGAVA
jgi:hypothetical protein